MTKSASQWFHAKGWEVFPFQQLCWQAIQSGQHGFLNAPTGSGKTYAVLLGLFEKIASQKKKAGLKIIWICPIRALSLEIHRASTEAIEGLGLDFTVGIRSGDTSASEKRKQDASMPDVLITTPESLHILLAKKGSEKRFGQLQAIIADEWHELMGNKRGVQLELAISRLRNANSKSVLLWAISATIGNLNEAIEVFLGPKLYGEIDKWALIQAQDQKQIQIEAILPDHINELPWAGHLGIKLLRKAVQVIRNHTSVLLFTNTRSQCEIWFQAILSEFPDFAGEIAMHHGSMDKEIRRYVEQALHDGHLNLVVCTASLDLGVDFRPVDAVIQVGSPKGVAKFLQRAGRSGHSPGQPSLIYFLPTHSLELLEVEALKQAILENQIEDRPAVIRPFDVMIQYMVTLAVGDGFYPEQLYSEIKETFSGQDITRDEFKWMLQFIVSGGSSLEAYSEFNRVSISDDSCYKVINQKIARQHRMSIGTIVSDTALYVKYKRGTRIGTIEEGFISSLKEGDAFFFSGKTLQLESIHNNDVIVRNSKAKHPKIPSWLGGRMPLSSNLSFYLKEQFKQKESNIHALLLPLFELQQTRSAVPKPGNLLIEVFKEKKNTHIYVYPLEGRLVHEAMACLLAKRISELQPVSFSMAMNDYGFQLLTDTPIQISEVLNKQLFSTENLKEDLQKALNFVELAKRKFRDIASVSGLVFHGYPGKSKKSSHLMASTQLFYQIFQEYEPENLLYHQAHEEALRDQMELGRLYRVLAEIQESEIVIQEIQKPSPLSFPIMVDSLNRERLSNEKLADRIARLQYSFKE